MLEGFRNALLGMIFLFIALWFAATVVAACLVLYIPTILWAVIMDIRRRYYAKES